MNIMSNSQFFYNVINILNILFLFLYLISMLIERTYIKRNLSRICKLSFDNESYFTKIDLGNYIVLSFLPIVIQIGFLREKIILKRKEVFPNPPILFSSINDKKMDTFFKKYKSWLYISNLKWIFGFSWFFTIGVIKLYFK